MRGPYLMLAGALLASPSQALARPEPTGERILGGVRRVG